MISRNVLTLAVALVTGAISSAAAQTPTVRNVGTDSVVVAAGEIFKAGSFHRFFLGDNHRDAWTTPIKVPILNLRTFHGGLRPTKTGGGAQTRSLRFTAADGYEFVFRSVRKVFSVLPEQYKGTVVWYVVRDEGSASHPLGAIAAAPMQAAAGVLHPTPVVAMMPDDPVLGEFSQAPAMVEPAARNGAHLVVQLRPADPASAVAETHEIDRLRGRGHRGGRAHISQ